MKQLQKTQIEQELQSITVSASLRNEWLRHLPPNQTNRRGRTVNFRRILYAVTAAAVFIVLQTGIFLLVHKRPPDDNSPGAFTSQPTMNIVENTGGITADTVETFSLLENGYVPFHEIVIPGDLDRQTEETNTAQGSMDANTPGNAYSGKSLTCAYQLYRETLCNIVIQYPENASGIQEPGTIHINGSAVQFYPDHPKGAAIVDFDARDAYKEIVIYDDGPSGDPNITIFRYDGTKIYEVGSIAGDWTADGTDVYPYYGTIWVNRNGRIIMPFQKINIIAARPVTAYCEIREYASNVSSREKDNTIIGVNVDCTSLVGKSYPFSNDISAYFLQTNTAPRHFSDLYDMVGDSSLWDTKLQKTFRKGSTFRLLKVGESNDPGSYWYYIELENGQKGVLYFWMGD